MKKYFILLLLLISFTYAYSQEALVKGQLFGEADNEFLPYATISVSRDAKMTTTVKKLPTDGKGFFKTELSEGDYFLAFQYVGKNTLVKQISVPKGGKELDLGKIVVMESSTELDEVSVVAQAPLVKVEIDKLTYNLKDDPESATSNVLDMLRKVPRSEEHTLNSSHL